MPNTQQPLDHVVYILGAGFSAPLGIPVMANFLEKSKDIFASDHEKYKHFAKVFETIDTMHKSKSYYDANLFNIEEILSILEMDEELDDQRERSLFIDYISDVITSFTPAPNNALHSKMSWIEDFFGSSPLNFYGYFVGSILNLNLSMNNQNDIFCQDAGPSHRVARYSIITLNYDMVLERCFNHIKYFAHAESSLGFSSSIEDDNNLWGNRAHLAKLHGSVDAKTIVPPTWNKALHAKIKPAWKLAYRALSEANQIRLIGYSLPIADAYIKYLLKAAIVKCEHLRRIDILCKDDKAGSTKKRYEEFIHFPNCRFRNADVKDYLQLNYQNCMTGAGRPDWVRMNHLEGSHELFFRDTE